MTLRETGKSELYAAFVDLQRIHRTHLAQHNVKYRTGMIDIANPLVQPGEFPGQLIPVPKPREKHGHIAVKPVDLLRHLIRIFSAKGDDAVVLDPFSGTGSTGVAAIMENRGFAGFEINGAMATTANQRIANALGDFGAPGEE